MTIEDLDFISLGYRVRGKFRFLAMMDRDKNVNIALKGVKKVQLVDADKYEITGTVEIREGNVPVIDAGGFNNMYGINPDGYIARYKTGYAYDSLDSAKFAVSEAIIGLA